MTKEFNKALRDIAGIESTNQCWYLVVYLYSFFGIKLSTINPAYQLFERQDFWYPVIEKQFMDVILFNKDHVGLVLNDKQYVHATNTVKLGSFNTNIEPMKVYRYGFSIPRS